MGGLLPEGVCPGCGAGAASDRDRCPSCGRAFGADEPRRYGWREAPPPAALRFFATTHGGLAVAAAAGAAFSWGLSLLLQGILPAGPGYEDATSTGTAVLAFAGGAAASGLVWVLARPPSPSRAGWALGLVLTGGYVLAALALAAEAALGAEDVLGLVTAAAGLAAAGIFAFLLAVGVRARGSFGRRP